MVECRLPNELAENALSCNRGQICRRRRRQVAKAVNPPQAARMKAGSGPGEEGICSDCSRQLLPTTAANDPGPALKRPFSATRLLTSVVPVGNGPPAPVMPPVKGAIV